MHEQRPQPHEYVIAAGDFLVPLNGSVHKPREEGAAFKTVRSILRPGDGHVLERNGGDMDAACSNASQICPFAAAGQATTDAIDDLIDLLAGSR